MALKSLGKKILVLGFLLIILIVIFAWQGDAFEGEYFEWVKTGISKVNPFKRMIGPELQLSEDSGLDLSDVNIKEIAEKAETMEQKEPSFAQATEVKEEEALVEVLIDEVMIGIGGPVKEQEEKLVILEKKITLEEIEQEVNRIAKDVDRIDKEVQALVALSK